MWQPEGEGPHIRITRIWQKHCNSAKLIYVDISVTYSHCIFILVFSLCYSSQNPPKGKSQKIHLFWWVQAFLTRSSQFLKHQHLHFWIDHSYITGRYIHLILSDSEDIRQKIGSKTGGRSPYGDWLLCPRQCLRRLSAREPESTTKSAKSHKLFQHLILDI